MNYVEKMQQRSLSLYQNAKELPWPQPELIVTCLEELRTALEELHIAEEELCQQNQELHLAREAAERERKRYQDLFEFAPDGYLITDVYGTVREANRAAARLLGMEQSSMPNQRVANFVVEEQRHFFISILNQLPALKRMQEWEIQLRGRREQRLDVAITVETVQDEESGQAIALRWLVRDVTERKRTEWHLQQMHLQNLQVLEAERLRSQLMRTLSHELRTPMNAILGFSNLLMRRFHESYDPQIVSMAERIFRNGKHLLELIEDMLDLATLRSNALEIHPEPFDLMRCVTETVEASRSLAEKKNLELRVHISCPRLQVVNDVDRVRQIVTNLVSNAIKFTERGSVTVEVWDLMEGRVAILVRDTGIGIAPADQPYIFQEFWQVNQSTTRLHSGTGMGLAIVRSLAHLMGGSVSVDSIPNQGTTFRVELPRRVCAED